ncbi:B- and T-lymphocyte attenuator-like [Clupea harengus]|uniref:B- and T-lymphocyte attenuator-like n=1 Tax=Clupea harengus TaxID=7950 RepID=A0A6P8GH94_CLUHA|nr:B- and T-lymphocyte attenuator-like [Clupea harengus]
MRMKEQPAMKTLLALLLWCIICPDGNAEDNTCFSEVRVKRNTVWKVLEMSTLKLSCPVKYCDKQPVITWCKLVDVENCTPLAENPNVKIWQHVPVNTEGNLTISYMVIQKITKYDSGLYRCGAFDSTAGHSITVNVTGK